MDVKHEEIDIKEEREAAAMPISDQHQYFCAHCPYHTTNKPSLKAHLKFHSTRKPFACDVCGYKTVDKSNLKSHMKVHTGEKPHHCKECDYKTTSKYYLKQHESIHSGGTLFRCSYCGQNFRHRASYNLHVRKHTGEEVILQCNQCNYKTVDKKYFKMHQSTHSDERPFPCKLCPYKAKIKKLLKKHERNMHSQPQEATQYPEVIEVDCHYVYVKFGPGCINRYSKDALPYDYDTYKNREQFMFELATVPDECVTFNSADFVIKEEPRDVLAHNYAYVNGLPIPIEDVKQEN